MTIHNSRDNSFKLILGNHTLFVQFLKDYIPLDLWEDLSPNDIEDVSERLVPLFQNSRDADTVKRVRLKGQDLPFFIIAIVEHQSTVDFNTPFRLLRYITLVLTDYEREVNEGRGKRSSTKDFRFPPVLPIVFYDGQSPWTAALNFTDRTLMREAFRRYIPSFEYCLVELNRYPMEHILQFKDELAVLMLIDKIDFKNKEEFLKEFPGYMKEIALKIPENLARLMGDVITVLLNRLEVPEEQIRETADLVNKKEVDRMFEHVVESYFEGKRLAREEGREEGREEVQTMILDLVRQGYSAEQIESIITDGN